MWLGTQFTCAPVSILNVIRVLLAPSVTLQLLHLQTDVFFVLLQDILGCSLSLTLHCHHCPLWRYWFVKIVYTPWKMSSFLACIAYLPPCRTDTIFMVHVSIISTCFLCVTCPSAIGVLYSFVCSFLPISAAVIFYSINLELCSFQYLHVLS